MSNELNRIPQPLGAECVLEERMAEIFERKNAAGEAAKKAERYTAKMERKVGQLVIEKEFLEKKCEQLGIDLSERP